MSDKMTFFIKYIPDIINFAIFYKENLIDKEITYSSKNHSLSVKFDKSNFLHLIGISYVHGAEKFFDDSSENKIDRTAIRFKDGNESFRLKLQVIAQCTSLLELPIYINDRWIIGNANYDGSIIKNKIYMIGLKDVTPFTKKPMSLINITTQPVHKYETVTQIRIKDVNTKLVTVIK